MERFAGPEDVLAVERVPIEARIKPPGDTITVKIPPVRPDTIDPVVLSPTR